MTWNTFRIRRARAHRCPHWARHCALERVHFLERIVDGPTHKGGKNPATLRVEYFIWNWKEAFRSYHAPLRWEYDSGDHQGAITHAPMCALANFGVTHIDISILPDRVWEVLWRSGVRGWGVGRVKMAIGSEPWGVVGEGLGVGRVGIAMGSLVAMSIGNVMRPVALRHAAFSHLSYLCSGAY